GAVSGLNIAAARLIRGAIPFSRDSNLPPNAPSGLPNPVALPPGRARLLTIPAPTGSATTRKTIGIVRGSLCTATVAVVPAVITNSGWGGAHLLGNHPDPIDVAGTPTQIDLHMATVVPVQL